MPALPTGTVTFLFTDVEGSTRLWEEHPERMRAALVQHDALVEFLTELHHGHVVKPRGEGDSRFCVFARATDAIAAAAAIQRALHEEPWPTPEPLRVRMALHTGEAELRESDYYGAAVNRCARLRAVSHGGQILLSGTTRDLVAGVLAGGAGLRDLGEHRLRDLGEPERVFQLVDSGRPDAFPPLRSLDALPNNLPLQLTSFVGREREMADVRDLLARHRLVTLSGAGGVGKTRLALQAVAELIDAYPDGVWFVDLAPLADPALVARVALGALGLRDVPSQTALSTLLDHLRTRRVLLVLDNCEHLVDAAARLTDAVIRRCPDLRVLATSREALGVAGEVTWRVPSLALPDPHPTPAAAEVGQYEAVRLFVERARLVQPSFQITDQQAPAVARVCRRLDGIPLAIELAAARVRVLAVEQIAARLDDRFQLLTGGGRTALPRQRTLHAALDWSHDLLSEPERALFRRVGVFAGGWTLEAAEAVGAVESIGRHQVLDLLTQLVDKSLVVAEAAGDEERYRLLETMRQYAEEKLLGAGEAGPARDRHRDWCLALAEQAEPELTGPRQGAWLDRLGAEHDNLRAALAWCRTSPGGGDVGLRLAPALLALWFQRGYAREGQAWLEDALARGGDAPAPLRARALSAAGFLAFRQGDLPRARVFLGEAVRLGRGSPDLRYFAPPRTTLAFVLIAQAEWEPARALLAEELAAARRAGDRRGEALVCGALGRFGTYTGEYAAARAWLGHAVGLSRAEGDSFGVQSSLIHSAVAAMGQGDYAAARAAHAESLAILRELGNREGLPLSHTILGNMARLEGNEDEARGLLAEGMRLFRDLGGERRYISWTLEGIAGSAAANGRMARAARLFGAAAAARAVGGDSVVPVLRDRNERDLARARAALGDEAFAAAWAEGEAMTVEDAIADALSDTDG